MNLTRQQLYEQVWNEPVTKVAKQLGLSDRGLGKLCDRFDIPVPPRGYWARKAHGHKDPPPPLPPSALSADAPIVIADPDARKQPRVATAPPVAAHEQAENRITVHEGRPRHPLVRQAATALRQAKADEYGRVWSRGVLEVRVSKNSLTRALAILDALLPALEQRGHQVTVRDNKTVATVSQEAIEFGLDERAIQKARILTDKERLELSRGGYVFNRHTYEPRGELTLTLKNVWGARHKWSDRKKAALEEQLNDVVAGFIVAAGLEKARRLERERQHEIWREEERRREEEAERVRRLEEWTKQWERAQRYRAFLDAMQKSFEHEEMPPKLATWFAWARDYVDQIDPIMARAPKES